MSEQVFYQKTIPVMGAYDVVVLGGGPAGVCAAVEAARCGANTVLVETTGMLGGMATSGMVGPFMTNYDRDGNRPVVGGIYREIIEHLHKRNAAILLENTDSPSIHTSFITKYHRHVTPFDAFQLQVLLDEMTEAAGVDVLLYTRYVDSLVENGAIKGVIVAALEGLRCIEGKIFIDCTGNADVAAASGVPTWKGEEETGIPQPGTLMFEMSGVVDDEIAAFGKRPKRPIKVYRAPKAGNYRINHEHVFNVDATDSRQMSAAHREARQQVIDTCRELNDNTPGFQNAQIASVASVLGVRESRHIEGKYKITVDDVHHGVKFDDRIAAYAFGMDVHIRSKEMTGNFKIEVADVYYIPYRSMQPVNIDNLLVAGKTISCFSQAAGGLRCMPAAMSMGQAAGAAAAMAVKAGKMPGEIDIPTLQKHLLERGAILD